MKSKKIINKMMINFVFIFSLFVISCDNPQEGKYIQWGSDNEIANDLIFRGMFHYYNIELEMALSYFKAAVDHDSTSFASYVMLGWMTPAGEIRDEYIEKAKKYVKGKNETSNLFVSIFDLASGEGLRERRHKVWSEMRELEPNGKFIHYFYALTKPTLDERMAELELLMNELKSSGRPYGHILNRLAYMHYGKGEKSKAKNYFNEYLAVYPGNNSNDSMGEYYFNEKDYKTSLKYYEKSLEHYSQSRSGIDKIKEIKTLMEE